MSLSDAVFQFKHDLLGNKERLMKILQSVETRQTADDEFLRTINCFEHLDQQYKYLSAGRVELIASFLPLNQPLYSLALFVLVPSLTANQVCFRPPVLMWEVFEQLTNLLVRDAENIVLCKDSRRVFINGHVNNADVVIFTGEYVNALDVKSFAKESTLFIFNGGAINPIIVTASADLESSARDIVRERLFNSGQDCMAPAAILVERCVSTELLHRILDILKDECVGLNSENETTVGQMIESKSIDLFVKMLSDYRDQLIYGGSFDAQNKLIEPTVFLFDSLREMPQQTFYAPVFFVGKYDTLEETAKFLSTAAALDLSGYLSIYSKDDDSVAYYRDMHKQVIVNESLFTFENANKPFGGYGLHCSFIELNGTMEAKPFLISEEIARAFYF